MNMGYKHPIQNLNTHLGSLNTWQSVKHTVLTVYDHVNVEVSSIIMQQTKHSFDWPWLKTWLL